MATLTIRNLDDETKRSLRLRAARHGVSMEQEARLLLAKAVRSPEHDPMERADGAAWYRSIRDLVDSYGPGDLEIPPRNRMMRDPPGFD